MESMNDTRRGISRGASVMLAVGVLALGILASAVLLWTSPREQPRDEKRAPKIVKTVEMRSKDQNITVTGYGTVIPSRSIVIRPEVRGRVLRHDPALVPGGFIAAGAELILIDPSDYQLALTEAQTTLEEARFELEVERGRQVVASREWNLLKGDVPESEANRSLVLREPHLRRTEALIAKAQNEIDKAQLDLSRTVVNAPFNVIVLEESVEIGQLVEPGSAVATLVGADEFWVRASLPIDMLRWIEFPTAERAGASVEVLLESGDGETVRRSGHVVRLLGDLEPTGRMARVLISVPNPLGSGGSDEVPMLLGSYVRVEISAGVLRDVVTIRREALREGDRVWLVDENRRLQIRPVTVLWSTRDSVIIENKLPQGQDLVVSGLRVALPGMEVNPKPADAIATSSSASAAKVSAPAPTESRMSP